MYGNIEIDYNYMKFRDVGHFLFFFTLFIAGSCDLKQENINSLIEEIEVAMESVEKRSENDWNELSLIMNELEEELNDNRDDFSEDQIKKVNKLKGKYAALLVRKEIHSLEETFSDIQDQVESFVEEINSN